MSKLIILEGVNIHQDSEGRFSLTDFWKASGGAKKDQPNTWLGLECTKAGIEYLRTQKSGSLKIYDPVSIVSGKGKKQGTYVCKELVYDYAAWLSPEFKFKVYKVFDEYVNDQIKEQDWKKLRHEASASFKVMNAVLLLQRQMQGKVSASYHFSNEARLINWALTGKFEGINRNSLTPEELDLLAKLEERNAVLIGVGIEYSERKMLLERFVIAWRKPLELPLAS